MSLLKRISWIPSVIVIVGLTVISSCKDDEKPKSGISFELDELEIAESNGSPISFHPLVINGATGVEVEVKVVLDRPLDVDALVYYSVGGTATMSKPTQLGDFEIEGGNNNYFSIAAGDTDATITLNVFEDAQFEFDASNNLFETVILTLESVVVGSAKIIPDGQNVFTLKIYEDDLLVFLDWAGREAGDVDMDLFAWIDYPSTDEVDFDIINQSITVGNADEFVNIPAGYPSGTYGLSYTYFDGTSDNLQFAVDIVNLGGNLNGSPADLSFNATYGLVNINNNGDIDNPGYAEAPIIVQTMVKNNFNYTGFTQIVVPNEGSRFKTYPTVPIDFSTRRIHSIFNDKIPFEISGIE